MYTDDACELFCTDSEDTLIVPWGDAAADGTPCNIGTNDMCISGICRVSPGLFYCNSESQNLIWCCVCVVFPENRLRLDCRLK